MLDWNMQPMKWISRNYSKHIRADKTRLADSLRYDHGGDQRLQTSSSMRRHAGGVDSYIVQTIQRSDVEGQD